jgi:pSer/pThr/pTyr-binding forkhead associated (FHA) protein
VRLGREGSVDFSFGDPRVFSPHAEVFFRQGQYYLRDLTESHATLLNGRAISSDAPLQENDLVELSESGPKMRYLGVGRFAEVIETVVAPPPPPPAEAPAQPELPAGSLADRVRSLFRR